MARHNKAKTAIFMAILIVFLITTTTWGFESTNYGPGCTPSHRNKYTRQELQSLAQKTCCSVGLHPNICAAMIEKESTYNPCVRATPTGKDNVGCHAYGIAQILCGTCRNAAARPGQYVARCEDYYDPDNGFAQMARYLQSVINAAARKGYSKEQLTARHIYNAYTSGPSNFLGAKGSGNKWVSQFMNKIFPKYSNIARNDCGGAVSPSTFTGVQKVPVFSTAKLPILSSSADPFTVDPLKQSQLKCNNEKVQNMGQYITHYKTHIEKFDKYYGQLVGHLKKVKVDLELQLKKCKTMGEVVKKSDYTKCGDDKLKKVTDILNGQKVENSEDKKPTDTQKEEPPKKKKKIMIDPGHGGRRQDAVQGEGDPFGAAKGSLVEKNIALDTASKAASILRSKGYDVVMTRTSDTYITLAKRAHMAASQKPDIFVSVHYNGGTGARGVVGIYCPQSGSSKLSNAIQSAVSSSTGLAGTSRADVRDLRFCRKNSMPSVYIEVAHTQKDFSKITSPGFIDRAAQGIANGIMQYVGDAPSATTAAAKAPEAKTDPLEEHLAKNEITPSICDEAVEKACMEKEQLKCEENREEKDLCSMCIKNHCNIGKECQKKPDWLPQDPLQSKDGVSAKDVFRPKKELKCDEEKVADPSEKDDYINFYTCNNPDEEIYSVQGTNIVVVPPLVTECKEHIAELVDLCVLTIKGKKHGPTYALSRVNYLIDFYEQKISPKAKESISTLNQLSNTYSKNAGEGSSSKSLAPLIQKLQEIGNSFSPNSVGAFQTVADEIVKLFRDSSLQEDIKKGGKGTEHEVCELKVDASKNSKGGVDYPWEDTCRVFNGFDDLKSWHDNAKKAYEEFEQKDPPATADPEPKPDKDPEPSIDPPATSEPKGNGDKTEVAGKKDPGELKIEQTEEQKTNEQLRLALEQKPDEFKQYMQKLHENLVKLRDFAADDLMKEQYHGCAYSAAMCIVKKDKEDLTELQSCKKIKVKDRNLDQWSDEGFSNAQEIGKQNPQKLFVKDCQLKYQTGTKTITNPYTPPHQQQPPHQQDQTTPPRQDPPPRDDPKSDAPDGEPKNDKPSDDPKNDQPGGGDPPTDDPKEDKKDADGDGIPDEKDNDHDNDGITDDKDKDKDNDGIPDNEDPDIDGNGIPDKHEDIDGDGIPNHVDDDMDGDGIPNDEDPDMDGNGILDKDEDIDGDGIPNGVDTDVDGDGIPNGADDDIDGDGIPNDKDDDMDGDGIANIDDPDMDGDGFPNEIDDDMDGNGIPDKDEDHDGDGIPNGVDPDYLNYEKGDIRNGESELCKESCQICLGTRESHCHAHRGVCICEESSDVWTSIDEKCTETANINEHDFLSCCMRLFNQEKMPEDVSRPEFVPNKCEYEVSNSFAFSIDYCQSMSSETGYCCSYAFDEMPMSEGCLLDHKSDFDDDGDGQIDEDPVDGIDNDKDGKMDEDGVTFIADIKDKKLADLVTITFSVLRNDFPASVFFAGDNNLNIVATLKNIGDKGLNGDIDIYLDVYEDCNCPECPEGVVCACSCYPESKKIHSVSIPFLLPKDTLKVQTDDISIPEESENKTIQVRAIITDPNDQTAEWKSELLYIIPKGAIAILDAYFIDEEGKPILTAYPFQEITGVVKGSFEYFPITSSVYMVEEEEEIISTTRKSYNFDTPQEEILLKTKHASFTPEDLGSVRRLGLTISNNSDTILFDQIFSEQPLPNPTCKGTIITSWCENQKTSFRLSYPAAFISIENPQLIIEDVRFLTSDGQALATEDISENSLAIAQIHMRNIATIPFDGGITSLVAYSKEGTLDFVENQASASMEPGKTAVINTEAILFSKKSPARLHIKAVDKNDVLWYDNYIDEIFMPRKSQFISSTSNDPLSDRTSIDTQVDFGVCRLHIRCDQCLPSCQLYINEGNCEVKPTFCDCTCESEEASPLYIDELSYGDDI